MKPSANLAKAVAVTSELTGTNLSEVAIRVMLDDLSKFPEEQVLGALVRCRKELKGRLTIADIIMRLEDGRPGPEEAWSMVPRSEYQSVVWTEEMAQSMPGVHSLLDSGDEVAARMAFKERYSKLVQQARDAGRQVSWSPSLGYDISGRTAVIEEAVRLKRLPLSSARMLLPDMTITDEMLAIASESVKRIGVQS